MSKRLACGIRRNTDRLSYRFKLQLAARHTPANELDVAGGSPLHNQRQRGDDFWPTRYRQAIDIAPIAAELDVIDASRVGRAGLGGKHQARSRAGRIGLIGDQLAGSIVDRKHSIERLAEAIV